MILIQFSSGKKYYRPKLDNTEDILKFLQKYLLFVLILSLRQLSFSASTFFLFLKFFSISLICIQYKATMSLLTFFELISAFSTYTFLLSFYRMAVSFKKTQFFAAFGAFSPPLFHLLIIYIKRCMFNTCASLQYVISIQTSSHAVLLFFFLHVLHRHLTFFSLPNLQFYNLIYTNYLFNQK